MARAKSSGDQGDRLVSKNRRAFYDYEVGETWEAGLALIGSEVRVLREHTADLTDAWVTITDGEAWLHGMRVPLLKHAAFAHEEKRKRKLLLHSHQIDALRSGIERDGMTVIALKVYFKRDRAKVEIALAKGKKRHDKRAAVKDREAKREASAAMRRGARG